MNRTMFFSLALLLAAWVPSGIASAPRLVCDEPLHDFGTVDGSAPASHTFTLRNEGDADLLIKKIHAPCGCTTFRLENKTLAPGSTLELPVTLSLAGRKGPQQKSLYLETNDPASPNLQLTMRGIVGNDLEITPPMLVLRQNAKSGAIEGEAKVRNTSGQPLACLEAKALEGKLEVVTSPLPDGSGFVIQAKAVSTLSPGQHREKIHLRLQGSQSGDKTLDALILKPVEFLIAPSVLRLDAKAASPLARTILVRSPNGKPFTVEAVEMPDPKMTSKIEPVSANTVRIVLGNITPEKSLDGKSLKVKIGGTDPKILTVPILVPR
jgi:hypothetical protein